MKKKNPNLFQQYIKEAFREMNENKFYFYTYGSLMNGLHNHNLLLQTGAEYIETVKLKGFTLYDLGNYPGTLKTNTNNVLIAEKYLINYDTLEQLDYLEDVKNKLYKRLKIKDSKGDIGFIYTCNPRLIDKFTKIVKSGYWKTYFLNQEKLGLKKRSNKADEI